MKERYIHQVKKELRAPRKIKREVLRDLKEIFASAKESGENENDVIIRLGEPASYAREVEAQLYGGTRRNKRRGWIYASVAASALSVFFFSVYGAVNAVPKGIIGGADAATNIKISGAFGWDAAFTALLFGIAAAVAAVQIIMNIARRGKDI
jgi:hypothetical protein